jgi:hypothetical protein
MGERDELPRAIFKWSLEDIRVLVVSQDAVVASLLTVPTIHHRPDINRASP